MTSFLTTKLLVILVAGAFFFARSDAQASSEGGGNGEGEMKREKVHMSEATHTSSLLILLLPRSPSKHTTVGARWRQIDWHGVHRQSPAGLFYGFECWRQCARRRGSR